jgi:hypothetical protein
LEQKSLLADIALGYGITVKINYNYNHRFKCVGKYSDCFFSVGERDFFDREKNPKCHNFRSIPLKKYEEPKEGVIQ